MVKTYNIKFTSRTAATLALWELHAWQVQQSKYSVSTKSGDERIYHASADMLDVITESLPAGYFIVEVEQKAKRTVSGL